MTRRRIAVLMEVLGRHDIKTLFLMRPHCQMFTL
jgi:hypothetical protein